jgi:hypothetical protein
MLSRPLDDLRDMLLTDYAWQTVNFTQLHESHSVDKPYIRKNYKDVLRELFDEGFIRAEIWLFSLSKKYNNDPQYKNKIGYAVMFDGDCFDNENYKN